MFKTELPKIKEGFTKVKNDMLFLSDKITSNYSEFIAHHNNLSKDIHNVTTNLQDQISHIKTNLLKPESLASNQEIQKIQQEIKDLKKIVSESHSEHLKISGLVENIKQNQNLAQEKQNDSFKLPPKHDTKDNKDHKQIKSDIKKLKEQTHSSELELFLLKEKLTQKDEEIKELKDISRKMFDIIDDLSRIELDMVNHQIKT